MRFRGLLYAQILRLEKNIQVFIMAMI